MNQAACIELLFTTGHLIGTGLNRDDLPKCKLNTPEIEQGILSYQDLHEAQYHRICQRRKGRPARRLDGTNGIDGKFGEITAELLETPRCGHPDYGPGAEPATGSGSWPAGCHADWPNNHAFTVSVDKSGMPSYLGSKDDPNSVFEQAWELQRLAYADMGIVFIRADGDRSANTQVTFVRGNGWIGLAIVPQNPRCRDTIWAKFDNRYSPSDLLNQWARLLAHEFGHNMGMGHSRGGIMNSYIVSGEFTPKAWRGDASEHKLARFFGGEPVDLGGGDDDDDNDDGDDDKKQPGIKFTGEIVCWKDGEVVSRMRGVPPIKTMGAE